MITEVFRSVIFIRLFNIALRGMTLASKFLLIFFLARLLDPAEVGLYGLVVVTVSYGIYFLGFDFYIFTTREILKAPLSIKGRLIKSQAGLSFLLCCLFLPLSIIVFSVELLPWWLAPWFLCLLVLEHINQEINRLLIALNRQLIASFVLFLRSGIWAIVIITWMAFNDAARSLESVLASWLVGGALATFVGVIEISRCGMGGWQDAIDWGWIKKGLLVAIPMLVSSLALRGLFTLDRYWYEAWVGLEALGAYVLFMGMATALQSFMDAAVFTFIYPAMITACAEKNGGVFRHKHRQMVVQSLVLIILFSLIAWVCLEPLLYWLDRPIYSDYQYAYKWLLLANVLFILGALPQYALYAQGLDKPIILSHVSGFFVFVLVTSFLGGLNKELAIPLGLCASCFFVLTVKSVAFYRLTPSCFKFKFLGG